MRREFSLFLSERPGHHLTWPDIRNHLSPSLFPGSSPASSLSHASKECQGRNPKEGVLAGDLGDLRPHLSLFNFVTEGKSFQISGPQLSSFFFLLFFFFFWRPTLDSRIQTGLKVKRWKKIYDSPSNHKKAGTVYTNIRQNWLLSKQNVPRGKERYFMRTDGAVHYDDYKHISTW